MLSKNKRKTNRHQLSKGTEPKLTTNKQDSKFKAEKSKQKVFVGKKANWRLPALLTTILIVVILVIPTLVVAPFVNGDANKNYAIEKDAPVAVVQEQSPFTINVVRLETKEKEVEHVPLEKYVIGVVASEMGIDFEEEALKAQAVAARTYVVNHLLNQPEPDNANITDGTQHQVYKNEEELREIWGQNYNNNISKLTKAVEATSGEIITFNNAPIMPAFFSTSNGFTENSEDYWENEFPYLRSVKSPWDEASPKFLDQRVFTLSQVEEALNVTLPKNNPFSIEITRTDSHRVSELKLASHSLSGREVREKLNLQSNDFKVEQNNDHLIFTTKGFGHGIGMSQYGANGMAEEGKTYQDIITYYYKDVTISTITETAPTLVSK